MNIEDVRPGARVRRALAHGRDWIGVVVRVDGSAAEVELTCADARYGLRFWASARELTERD